MPSPSVLIRQRQSCRSALVCFSSRTTCFYIRARSASRSSLRNASVPRGALQLLLRMLNSNCSITFPTCEAVHLCSSVLRQTVANKVFVQKARTDQPRVCKCSRGNGSVVACGSVDERFVWMARTVLPRVALSLWKGSRVSPMCVLSTG